MSWLFLLNQKWSGRGGIGYVEIGCARSNFVSGGWRFGKHGFPSLDGGLVTPNVLGLVPGPFLPLSRGFVLRSSSLLPPSPDLTLMVYCSALFAPRILPCPVPAWLELFWSLLFFVLVLVLVVVLVLLLCLFLLLLLIFL